MSNVLLDPFIKICYGWGGGGGGAFIFGGALNINHVLHPLDCQ